MFCSAVSNSDERDGPSCSSAGLNSPASRQQLVYSVSVHHSPFHSSDFFMFTISAQSEACTPMFWTLKKKVALLLLFVLIPDFFPPESD